MHAAGNRLCDRPLVGRVEAAVGLDELKRICGAVADPDHLVDRRDRGSRGGRGMIERIAPAEAVQASAPFLEEGHHGGERLETLDAIARIIAAPRMRPAGIALLAARAEHNDFGVALRSACALERNVERKQHLVEGRGHYRLLCPRATARAIWPVR